MLSIVLPTFNESRTDYLPRILANLQQVADAQVILVDGGSSDGTLEQLKATGFQVLELPASTRAARLNLGVREASGNSVLLHHPRSLIDPKAFEQVQQICASPGAVWGGLSHYFDYDHPLLRFTSWYSNHVRLDRGGIVYLDHCIFFNRFFLERGVQIPDVEIFEDTELSLLLRQHSKPVRLSVQAQTSAVRFTRNGVMRQSLMNQALKLGYFLRLSPKRMNRFYEKGLDLNK